MLNGFRDAILIARASVVEDFDPFGWVSISFVVALLRSFAHPRLFAWFVSPTPSCSIQGSGGVTPGFRR
jgi:hypothetical protein